MEKQGERGEDYKEMGQEEKRRKVVVENGKKP